MIPEHIIIHHSLTKDSQTVSWGAIRKYHISQGMVECGYHYGLELIGDHYEILVGRMSDEEGAHCKEGGMNHCSLGICVVGNYDESELPREAFELLVRLVRSLMTLFKIPLGMVHRHHDYATYKSCPGARFPWAKFISALEG